MRIKTFLFLVIFISLNVVHAQQLGFRGGVNLNNTNVDLNGIDKKSKIGFDLGIMSDFNLPFHEWTINTGILFSKQRFELKQDYGNNVGVTYNFITNNIEVPVTVRKEFNLTLVKPFIQIGLYSSYAISGKLKDGETKHSLDFNKNIDRFNAGLTAGIGSYLTKNIYFLINYDHGLRKNKIGFGDENITLKKRKWLLSAGYTF